MKKSLIALAAVAVSGLAMAQSSVTLYGVADIAVGNGAPGGGEKKTGAFTNGALNSATSRIGFRGVEDLGNGLKVSFQLEQAVNLADGSTASKTFARQAWVGLSGGFGALRAGRQLTPTYEGIATWEITGAANYAISDQVFGYGGGSRDDALIKYTSPSFGGFKVVAGYVFEDNYTTGSDGGHYDLALIYANGPLGAAITYNGAEVNGVDEDNASLGLSYDFGGFKVAGSYQYNDYRNLKGYTLGASLPLGAFRIAADVGYAERRDSDVDGVDFVLSATYALSKRTSLYGVYYRADEDGPRFGSHFGEENNFSIGLRHNF